MLPQRTQGLPTATTNSITYVFLITAAAEIQQMLAFQQPFHHNTASVFSLLTSVSLEVVRGARISYFVDENTLGEILHNCSQPLAALSNHWGIFKSLWSEHIPPTPESELWGPSLNSF